MMRQNYFMLQHRDFGLFWLGSFLLNIGVQIETISIGWQVYAQARQTMDVANSAFMMGLVGLSQFLPLFALTLYAGSIADRHSRRGIVLISLVVQFFSTMGLIVLALNPGHNLSYIFAMVAIFGAARAFLAPAASALVPMLVPRDQMHIAISLKSLSWQTATIIGPWVGGVIIAMANSAVAFTVSAALLLISIVLIFMMKTPSTPERQPGTNWQQIKDGLVYTYSNKIVFGAISLDLFAVLLGGATALLPAFASDILNVGPQGFGLLRSGPAIGAVAMALAIARWPLVRRAGARLFMAVAAFGIATLVFALSRNIYVSMAALAALGAADMVSVYVRQTLVQVVTPDHMRGRVSSVSGLFISGSNELGEFESGLASKFIGPVGAAVFGGIGTLIVTGLWARLFPDLRAADRLDGTDLSSHH